MSNLKMSVVIRRDLNMAPGLLAAQVLHAGMSFIQSNVKNGSPVKEDGEYPGSPAGMSTIFNVNQSEWIIQPYVAVLGVDTPEELYEVIKMAKLEGLPVHEWKDVIPSKVLEGRVLECLVGISIGPADSDALRKVTGTLPLY